MTGPRCERDRDPPRRVSELDRPTPAGSSLAPEDVGIAVCRISFGMLLYNVVDEHHEYKKYTVTNFQRCCSRSKDALKE